MGLWLDISKYQARRINLLTGNWDPTNWDPAKIDWDKIALEAEGVLVRIGDGLNLDPCYERFRAACIVRGIRWGIYHLHRPTVSAAKQIAFMKAHQPDLPPAGVWADLEVTDGVTGQAYFNAANDYLMAIDEEYGIKAGIYSGAWFLDPTVPVALQRRWADRLGWWASYPNLYIPQGWAGVDQGWALHQFANNYPWRGLPKPADASRLNPAIKLADLLPGEGSSPPPLPAPPPVAPGLPAGDRGTRIGIHAIQPQETMPLVRALASAGARVASVLAVEQAGLLMDVKAISPATTAILRFYTPQWDGLDGIGDWSLDQIEATARAIWEYLRTRRAMLAPAEREAVDLWALLNEADPPTVRGWKNYGTLCIRLAWWATAEGIRLCLPGWNNGTPEYAELVAFFSLGLADALVAGRHVLNIHEGVHPPTAAVGIVLGTIPGAPFPVAGAGPLALRYRFAVDHLRRTGQPVPDLYVGEFYGGSYMAEDRALTLTNFKFYDQQVRSDPWLRAFHGFTMDPGGWAQQDYNPLMRSPEMASYIIAEREKLNTASAPPLPDVIPGETMAQYLITIDDKISMGVLRQRIGAIDLLDIRVVIPAGNTPDPAPWFASLPMGVLSPVRTLAAPGRALTIYKRDGTPFSPHPLLDAAGKPRVITWTMAASEHVLAGGADLLRVLDNAGSDNDWYVRAADVSPFIG